MPIKQFSQPLPSFDEDFEGDVTLFALSTDLECPVNNVCDYVPPDCNPSYLEEGHELILQIVEDRDDGDFTCPTGQYSQNHGGNGLTFGRGYIADAAQYIY